MIAMVRNDAPWLADLVGGLTPLDAADVHACGGYALRHRLVGPFHSESLRRLAGRAMLNMLARI